MHMSDFGQYNEMEELVLTKYFGHKDRVFLKNWDKYTCKNGKVILKELITGAHLHYVIIIYEKFLRNLRKETSLLLDQKSVNDLIIYNVVTWVPFDVWLFCENLSEKHGD